MVVVLLPAVLLLPVAVLLPAAAPWSLCGSALVEPELPEIPVVLVVLEVFEVAEFWLLISRGVVDDGVVEPCGQVHGVAEVVPAVPVAPTAAP